jgi:hypothetical protein
LNESEITMSQPRSHPAAEAPRRSRTWLAAVAGVAAGSVAAMTLGGASALPSAAPAPVHPEVSVTAAAATVPRVAVISKLLDAFATGAAAGPGVINGLVATVVGSQHVPPPGDAVQSAAIQTVVDVGAQITQQGPAAIDAFRQAIAPMACANPAINAGIEAFAGGLDAVSGLGATIAPLDLTATEMATLLRGFEASPETC